MRVFTRYDKETGVILGQSFGMDPSMLPSEDGLLEGAWDPRLYRVDNERPVLLGTMDLIVEGRSIKNLPPNSVLLFREEKYLASDEWEASGSGEDVVIVTNPYYRTETVRIAGYDAARAEEYPEIGDQLDAIWKTLAKMKKLPVEAQEMLTQIAEVKAKHPK